MNIPRMHLHEVRRNFQKAHKEINLCGCKDAGLYRMMGEILKAGF